MEGEKGRRGDEVGIRGNRVTLNWNGAIFCHWQNVPAERKRCKICNNDKEPWKQSTEFYVPEHLDVHRAKANEEEEENKDDGL